MVYKQEMKEDVNLDAYMPTEQSEQAGVVHLIHGRIQQANPKKVFITQYKPKGY